MERELVDGFLCHGLDQVTLEAGDASLFAHGVLDVVRERDQAELAQPGDTLHLFGQLQAAGIRQVEVEEHHAGLE